MTEPEYAQTETAKALAAFTAAGEGAERLNTAQYTAFQQTMVASEKAKGQFVDERAESFIAEYNALNAINPAADGISQEEWFAGMGIMMDNFIKHLLNDGFFDWETFEWRNYSSIEQFIKEKLAQK